MVTMTERLERKVKRQKRHELLIEQTVIREKHCAGCKNNSVGKIDNCVGCVAFARLNRIGRELLNMSQEKRDKNKEEAIEQLRKFGLTKATYAKAMANEITNNEIRNILHISFETLKKWRRDNDLIEKYFKMDETYYRSLRRSGKTDEEIAERQGVQIETLNHWKKVNKVNCGRKQNENKYEMYRGEEMVGIGTVEELAKKAGLKAATVRGFCIPSYKKKVEKMKRPYWLKEVKEEQTC